jgi:Tfp pilus assembly protein PilO
MIIEKFTKLNDSKRKTAAVSVVLVIVFICYFAITRNSLVKLRAAKANYTDVRAVYVNAEYQETEVSNLQKQLMEKQKTLKEYQLQSFNSTQAVQFFRSISPMALVYDLKPISNVITESYNLSDNKKNPEMSETQRQFLKIQSARVTVSGNYFDIVDFMNELVDCTQIVCITNLRIALPAGENLNPQASFKVTILIDMSKGQEE